MTVTIDGGPDENLRYTSTINCANDYFDEHNLDAYSVATNVPGQSTFNQVERKMSNLGKELSGVILPQTILVPIQIITITVYEKLEPKQFERAGEILAKVWSNLVISDHSVVAKFVGEEPLGITIPKSEEWKASHIRAP